MENRLPVDIEDVDDDGVIEIDVVLQFEHESARGSSVLLAVLAVSRQAVEDSFVDVVAGSFEHLLQSTD
jgi:hypothetical protein